MSSGTGARPFSGNDVEQSFASVIEPPEHPPEGNDCDDE